MHTNLTSSLIFSFNAPMLLQNTLVINSTCKKIRLFPLLSSYRPFRKLQADRNGLLNTISQMAQFSFFGFFEEQKKQWAVYIQLGAGPDMFSY
jgi:hypothetical protein